MILTHLHVVGWCFKMRAEEGFVQPKIIEPGQDLRHRVFPTAGALPVRLSISNNRHVALCSFRWLTTNATRVLYWALGTTSRPETSSPRKSARDKSKESKSGDGWVKPPLGKSLSSLPSLTSHIRSSTHDSHKGIPSPLPIRRVSPRVSAERGGEQVRQCGNQSRARTETAAAADD